MFDNYKIKILPPERTPTGKKLEDIDIPRCPKGIFNRREKQPIRGCLPSPALVAVQGLCGQKFRIGRTDCYTLAVQARALLGKPPLPKYYNYLAQSYTELIEEGLDQMRAIQQPVDGCLVVINAAELALGVYCQDLVLCFNGRKISDMIPLSEMPILGYYDR